MSKAAKQLREKEGVNLQEELMALRREYFNLRMQKAAQQTSKTSEMRRVRRSIARVITLIGEQQRSAQS